METNTVQASPLVQPSKSGLGIAGFVLGIIALATSFLPIINNFSALLAVIGFVLALIGMIACVKGRKSGKGLSIAGVVMNVIAFVVVLATQSMYSSAIDDVFSGTSVAPQPANEQPATTAPASDEAADNSQTTAAGNSITLKNGLVLTVDGVVTGLQSYDGKPITQVSVTYQNNGNSQASFNPYDWKAEDAQGAQRSQAFYTDGDNELHSGTLAAGGTVSGNLYFEGDVVKVLYETPSSAAVRMSPGTSSKLREKSCPSGRAAASVSDGHFFATMESRKRKPAKRRRKRRVKEPMTEDLLNELLDSPDPAAFASKHKLACRNLPEYLQQLLDERGLRRPEVVRQAGINPTFGYQIFVGQRNPSRNKLLQLAFAMKLSLRETNRLLQAGGCNELYCKNRRDAIIIFCIDHGETLQTVDEQLYAFYEDTITE